MKLGFEYGTTRIEYNLTYKKRSSISIQVEADGQVNVVAPVGSTVFTIMDKVKGNAEWIISELERIAIAKEATLKYVYLGKNYGVELIEDATKEDITVKLVRGKFVVEGSDLSKVRVSGAMRLWYINKATSKAKERAKAFLEGFENKPKKIQVDVLKDSLYTIDKENNNLVLDVNCAIGPVNVLDYMLVGGLCKLSEMDNDSTNLKIKELIPDFELAEEWLRTSQDKFLFS
ncbi:MAG: YgjP-like metallopeptidase domain-containing protein [Cellulosilyticaceae bacterium]